jgi:hypothetical protein
MASGGFFLSSSFPLLSRSGIILDGAKALKIDPFLHKNVLSKNHVGVYYNILEVATTVTGSSASAAGSNDNTANHPIVFVRKDDFAATKSLCEMLRYADEDRASEQDIEILPLEGLFKALKQIVPAYVKKNFGVTYSKSSSIFILKNIIVN